MSLWDNMGPVFPERARYFGQVSDVAVTLHDLTWWDRNAQVPNSVALMPPRSLSRPSPPASFLTFWAVHPDARQGTPAHVAYKVARYHTEWHLGLMLAELDPGEQAFLEFDPSI